jgi:hypothetical protein
MDEKERDERDINDPERIEERKAKAAKRRPPIANDD